MSRTNSPLRYPGGKTCLLPIVGQILRENGLAHQPYAEPFAGGCGLALALLYGSHVSEVHINDVDPSIWSFWHSVLNLNEEFCELVASADVTIEEWHTQRDVYLQQNFDNPLRLGFATFFLNRTNRSGIIKGAGVIGGLNQTGKYKIDCRFNRSDLVRRIKRVCKYRRRIHLHRLDALDFLAQIDQFLPTRSLTCIDPPYFNKGSSLYTSFYKREDHESLSRTILSLDRPWLLTYDDAAAIRDLYSDCGQYSFDVQYSVETKRIGTELMVAQSSLLLPPSVTSKKVA